MKNIIVLAALSMMTLVSCRVDEEESVLPEGPINIVTTTGIIEDCVERICKSKAEVSAIMGPGTDPHIYKPTPGDIDLLDRADIIVANGLHLEGKMAEMLEKYSQEKPVIFIADGIAPEDLIKTADVKDAYDPHIWFDIDLWLQGLEYFAHEMADIDTANAKVYIQNYSNFKTEAMEVDQWIVKEFHDVDTSNRILITSHDAFSYYGRRYNISVKGIQGVSTLSEVGLKEISDMVDFIVAKNVKAIFVETSTSDKTAKSIQDGVNKKGKELAIEGPLFSDALGEPDSEGGTYLGMIKANTAMIKKAFE